MYGKYQKKYGAYYAVIAFDHSDSPGHNISGYIPFLHITFSIGCIGRFADWSYFDAAVAEILQRIEAEKR
jgi:hypothetical protein